MKKFQIEATIKVPRVPNFLFIEGLSGEDGKLSIADVLDDDLVRLSSAWLSDLLERKKEILSERALVSSDT